MTDYDNPSLQKTALWSVLILASYATNNIALVNPGIPIIALNVNKLNSPMESHRVAGCD